MRFHQLTLVLAAAGLSASLSGEAQTPPTAKAVTRVVRNPRRCFIHPPVGDQGRPVRPAPVSYAALRAEPCRTADWT